MILKYGSLALILSRFKWLAHNGRSIIVLVNDRGPFKKGRLIDLSHGAAKKIGVNGLAKVKVEYIGSLTEND